MDVSFLLPMSSVVPFCCRGQPESRLRFSQRCSETLTLSSRTARVPGGKAMKQLIPKGLIQHRAWKGGKGCSANPAVLSHPAARSWGHAAKDTHGKVACGDGTGRSGDARERSLN